MWILVELNFSSTFFNAKRKLLYLCNMKRDECKQ
jgi:hypothetical protein